MNTFSIQNFLKRGDSIVLTLRPEGSNTGGLGRQWDEDDTSLLLSLMEKFGIEFKEKVKKRSQIWMEIAENLNSHGYPWSFEDCRKKWSNLLRTFKVAHDAKHDPANSKRSRWLFYENVSEMLMSEIGIYLPEASTLVRTMNTYSPTIHPEFTTEEITSDSGNVEISGGDHQYQLSSTSAILLHQSTVDDVTHQLQSFMTSEEMVGEYGSNIEVLTTGHESNESNPVVSDEGRLIEIHNVNVNSFHQTQAQEDLISASSIILQSEVIPHSLPPTVQVLSPLVPDTKSSRPLKSEDKNKPPGGRRRNQKRERKTEFPEGNDDPGISRLISVTMEHNERVLAQMKQFHEDVLGVMRERNKTLNDLCEFMRRS